MKALQNIDKLNIKEDLTNILDKYSSNNLTDKETKNLYDRDKNVKYYMKLLNEFKESSSSSEDHFINSLIKFMNSALTSDKDELHQITLIYIQLIASYITDFFNTQNLKNKKKHIKKMKKLFIDSTHNIIKTYEAELLKTLKTIENS